MGVDRKPFFSVSAIAKRGWGAMTIFLPLYLFSVLQLFPRGGSSRERTTRDLALHSRPLDRSRSKPLSSLGLFSSLTLIPL
jgi:hypothetical protein